MLEQPAYSNSSNSTTAMPSTNTENPQKEISQSKMITKQRDERQNKNDKTNNDLNSDKLCVICRDETRQIACIPCGHLVACVACGHSVKICPVCKTIITAFIRIYT